MIRRYLQVLAIASLTILGLASCNKDIETIRAINVTFKGFNLSNMQLEVSLDTVIFDKKIQPANARVNFSMVYPYFGGKKEAILTVKDKVSGKELFQKTLPLSGSQLEFFYPLVNIDGKLLDITPPAADPATNKLGFYIYYTKNNDPIDILMYNQNTGQQAYLAKNAVPQTWVYTDYLPDPAFPDGNAVGSSTIYFLKAGTFDFAFNDSESLSQTSGFGWYIPHNKFTGNKVQLYFIQPSPQGFGTEMAQLFPIPKGY
ncbi:hypothetical protein GFS24_03960 [Chitinophaga sp. SYP-B3965]|uniref:hypothetical protein n=1 Tax=Chitinophaga sp. SYP-B3965 TaxID=2663120 RepID=UPI001299D43E|nr:hypothetical protein [Chitinophaga sp. SYP-B3965]MRG44252.1 hypothetical protein [Chitinophaga sp. SYP-B3965]